MPQALLLLGSVSPNAPGAAQFLGDFLAVP